MVLQDPGDAKDRSTDTGKTSRHAEEAFHIRERETAATLLTRHQFLVSMLFFFDPFRSATLYEHYL